MFINFNVYVWRDLRKYYIREIKEKVMKKE